jgi:hypothetical protein
VKSNKKMTNRKGIEHTQEIAGRKIVFENSVTERSYVFLIGTNINLIVFEKNFY